MVSVVNLHKRYGDTVGACGVSFEVRPGRIFGLLGPNGAGKTTTLECILGLRQPDSGSIRIQGCDIREDSTRAKLHMGAQLQAATLQDKITPRQALDLFGSFYPHAFSSEELLRRFDLEEHADITFAALSGGQRQKLFLALALVHRPNLLVLDEPTAGLDPQTRRTLRTLIREIQSEGRTVLLSTHDLEEAAQLCDQVAILDRGRVVAAGSPAELVSRAQSPVRVVVRTARPLPENTMESLPEATRTLFVGGEWIFETRSPNRLLAQIVRCADEAGAELLDVQLHRPSLEDVFIELTGRGWGGGP